MLPITAQRRLAATSWSGYMFVYPLLLLVWVLFVWVFVYMHRSSFPNDPFVHNSAEDVFLWQAIDRP